MPRLDDKNTYVATYSYTGARFTRITEEKPNAIVLFIIKRFEIASIFVALAILIGGVIYSVIHGAWFPFQRSGSLLVCLAASLYFLDKKMIFDKLYMPAIEERVNKIKPYWPGVDVDKMKRTNRDMYISFYRGLLESRIRKVEILIVLLGTFVWGFGDLVPISLGE